MTNVIVGLLGHESSCECALCEDLAPVRDRLTRLEAVLAAARELFVEIEGDAVRDGFPKEFFTDGERFSFAEMKLAEAIRACDSQEDGKGEKP